MDILNSMVEGGRYVLFQFVTPLVGYLLSQNVLHIHQSPAILFSQQLSHSFLATLPRANNGYIVRLGKLRGLLKVLPRVAQEFLLVLLVIEEKHSPGIITGEFNLTRDYLLLQKQLNWVHLLPLRPLSRNLLFLQIQGQQFLLTTALQLKG
jgi:hypothetical protein